MNQNMKTLRPKGRSFSQSIVFIPYRENFAPVHLLAKARGFLWCGIKALTPEQTADILQVNPVMVYKMIQNGELLAKKIGKKLYRISPVSLSWLITGLDQDIYQMEREDKKNLLQINKLLKQVRKK